MIDTVLKERFQTQVKTVSKGDSTNWSYEISELTKIIEKKCRKISADTEKTYNEPFL